jgi:alpha-beta hydrolase superfamily lysophospholipase
LQNVAHVPSVPKRLGLKIASESAARLLGEPVHIAVDVVFPAKAPRALIVCVPGGGMNRRYFDLPTPAGEPEASFACALAAHGFAAAVIDPLGVGESTVPRDPYQVHIDLQAAAQVDVCRYLQEGLRRGTLDPSCPPVPDLKSFGAGHSLGAMTTVIQQAAHPIHSGLMLCGFHTYGQPQHISAEDAALDPAWVRTHMPELIRSRNLQPYFTLKPPATKQRVSAAVAMEPHLMMMSALSSTIPNVVAEDAAKLTVPIMLVFGDNDVNIDPHKAVAAYTGSGDISLLILKDTKHNHVIYPTRTLMFDRVAAWMERI